MKLFTEALLAETKDADELRAGWIEFKRTYDRAFWPVPGIVCKAIRERRSETRAYQHSHRPMIAAPDYHKPEFVSQHTRNATLTALAQADAMTRSADAWERKLGAQLVALGLAIINRNGQPAEELPL